MRLKRVSQGNHARAGDMQMLTSPTKRATEALFIPLIRSRRIQFCLSLLSLSLVGLFFHLLISGPDLEEKFVEASFMKYEVILRKLAFHIETEMPGDEHITTERFQNTLHETVRLILHHYHKDVCHNSAEDQCSVNLNDLHLLIVSPQGRTLYTASGRKSAPTPLSLASAAGSPAGTHVPAEGEPFQKLMISCPYRDPRSNDFGKLTMIFPPGTRTRLVEPLREFVKQASILVSIATALGLFFLFKRLPHDSFKGLRHRAALSVSLICAITGPQFGTSMLSVGYLVKHLLHESQTMTEVTETAIESDLKPLLVSKIGTMDAHDRTMTIDVFTRALTTPSQQVLWRSGAEKPTATTLHPAHEFGGGDDVWESICRLFRMQTLSRTFLVSEAEDPSGPTVVEISPLIDHIVTRLGKVFINALTITFIMIFVSIEAVVFIFWIIQKKNHTRVQPEVHAENQYMAMRPAAFLFLFGIDSSMSFIPLHMAQLYEPMFGLPREFILGLPITVEFVSVGLGIFISGIWADRRGWHEPFVGGLLMAASGTLMSWLTVGALNFILTRAAAGLGYGFALMASQSYVIRYSSNHQKALALSQLIAGIYAGSICGGAAGAMLADRFGYPLVFLVGAALLYGVVFYAMAFMRKEMVSVRSATKASAVPRRVHWSTYVSFLTDVRILSVIFLSSLPASIAVVGFLNYFCPLYLKNMGATQSTIGRVLMIYGVSLIYLGPLIGRYVDQGGDKRRYVFFGCLLASLTFLSFHLFEGITAAVIGVFILGLSSSFVLSAQSAYILQLRVTKELGEGRAIGIFRSTSRIGQALGPVVFSGLMAAGGLTQEIAVAGAAYIATALLFYVLSAGDGQVKLWGLVKSGTRNPGIKGASDASSPTRLKS